MSLNALLGQLMRSGGSALRKGNEVLDTPGKKLLAGGAAAGLLFGGGGRILKYGGVAALGAVAYHAWQQYQAGQKGGAAAPEALPEPPADSNYLPQDEAQREALAKLLIAAMVTAAKADGRIDAEEQQAMIAHAEQLDLTPEEQSLLFAEMGKPFDMEPVVRGAASPEVAAEVYAASLVAVATPSPAERAYLKTLAGRLGLPEPVVESLHETLGAKPA